MKSKTLFNDHQMVFEGLNKYAIPNKYAISNEYAIPNEFAIPNEYAIPNEIDEL